MNKARLIERIAELAREKKIDGITDINDESDRSGMRIVIEVRRDISASVIINNLYKMTALQTTFGINMLALVDNHPKVLNLKQILYHYLEHQKIVIRRRTEFELRKAEARAHILEGLRIALDNIDAVIALIRSSNTTETAKEGLMTKFQLSDKQAQAILDMRLQRLTGLERSKIEEEYQNLMTLINDLKAVLADEERILEIIREELEEIKIKYADKRRTEILTGDIVNIEDEDLIPEEEVAITLTKRGYIKRLPLSTYRSQRRGGRGIQGMSTHEDDFVEHLVAASSHDTLLFFTNTGKVYRAKGYEIPEYGRTAKGIPLINLLGIESQEQVNAVINVSEFTENSHLFFTTKHGVVKRTDISQFAKIRQSGLRAVDLRENDELISVQITDGNKNIIIATKQGQSIYFPENNIRVMGRTAAGVRGIRLREDDEVIGMEILEDDQKVLIVTEKGYGKQTPAAQYPLRNRGGMGVKTVTITEKNGNLVAMKTVSGEEDIMLMTVSGVMIRFEIGTVSQTGRSAMGVKLIRLDENEKVATVAKVPKEEILDEEEEISEELIVEVPDESFEDTPPSDEI
ncbi:DNA gyrase subunit A [Listeria grayi FSL F6-1183]|uniref:DNA topoisomerase (ATP-hydrolyzing) n=1 Tax=Listeria grayi FSL F6-1183 TaxID=1265827 RepID=A0A829R6Z5_LISGR|nr:DNA gyrase subunit A [Listeria grayi FSL F6-1183]